MKRWKIALMGAGTIAGKMAKTVAKMEQAEVYAIGSRSEDRAEQFAREYGIEKAYGSYEALVSDPQIDLVYVATPHSEHFANASLCIRAGKPVLCEKALTANAKQARELLQLAEQEKVFFTEAMWTRYMPMLQIIRKEISAGTIGEINLITAGLGYPSAQRPRIQSPELAGGALLDLGVYPLNFAMMLFGNEISKISSCCTYLPTGVDAQNSFTMLYADGKMAQLHSSVLARTDRRGNLYGTNGFMTVDNVTNFEKLTVYDSDYRVIKEIPRPVQITGYEYEVEASLKALEEGRLECEEMPHAESLRVMEIMDSLRESWGIRYPFET